jgi:hypothetical protein
LRKRRVAKPTFDCGEVHQDPDDEKNAQQFFESRR